MVVVAVVVVVVVVEQKMTEACDFAVECLLW